MKARVTRMSAMGRDWLADFEGGYRTRAYLCPAGHYTISAGVTRYPSREWLKLIKRKTDSDDLRVQPLDEIDARLAVGLFIAALPRYEEAVDAVTRDDLTQGQFDALVDFCFNVGEGALRSSTLLQRVNLHAPVAEIRRQFVRWKYAETDPDQPGLEVVPGLLRRREAEALVYAGGDYLGYDAIAERLSREAA